MRKSNDQGRRPVLSALTRVVAGVLASLLVAVAAGAAYEGIAGANDALNYPPAGRLVDVGGYRLHLNCMGEGTPVVVMDSGLGGSSLDWILVQSELAGATRICVYDRAGMGWSEPGPLPRSPKRIADELHLLLEAADVPGPYLLVGHSLAGKNVRMFARAYPEDVAAIVLVDARSELIDARTSRSGAEAFNAAIKGQATTYSIARHLGIARLFGAGLIDLPLVPEAVALEMALLQTRPNAIGEAAEEGLARSVDDATLAGTTLGSIPLVVVAAAGTMMSQPDWPAAQDALVALSTKGHLIVAEHSNHAIQLEEPNVVIAAVREVLTDVRSNP